MDLTETLKAKKLNINDLHNLETLRDEATIYALKIEKRKIDLGYPKLFNEIRGLRVQELLTVVSPTGVGKSAFALNCILNFAKTGELAVYFSLEMSEIGIFERIAQRELDLFGNEVERALINRDKNFLDKVDELKEKLSNILIINKRLDIQQIRDWIEIIEDKQGHKVRFVCVDYLGLVKNDFHRNNEYMRQTENMTKLYEYAKELDIAILNLSQTSRVNAKENELDIYSAKGSGEVENSSDFFLTLERIDQPKKPEEVDRYRKLKEQNSELDLMRLTVHKNRRGRKAIIYMSFNRKNLRILEL